jgi:hypothetical protein
LIRNQQVLVQVRAPAPVFLKENIEIATSPAISSSPGGRMVDGAEPTDDPLRVERANGSIPVWLGRQDNGRERGLACDF